MAIPSPIPGNLRSSLTSSSSQQLLAVGPDHFRGAVIGVYLEPHLALDLRELGQLLEGRGEFVTSFMLPVTAMIPLSDSPVLT